MRKSYRFALALASSLVAIACSSNNNGNGGAAGTEFTVNGISGTGVLPGSSGTTSQAPGPQVTMTTGVAGTNPVITAGKGGTSGMAGMMAAGGHGGSTAGAGGGTSGAGGAAGGGASGSGAAGGGASGSFTGTLGALGAAKPIANAWATTNGFELLIYVSSSPLTCAQMMTMGTKWLSTLPAGTQVEEIVLQPTPSVTTYMLGSGPAAFGGAEVNYAEGSKSSATETTGTTGTVTITKTMPMGVQEGMISVTAPFMLSGSFHAEWCQGGTEY